MDIFEALEIEYDEVGVDPEVGHEEEELRQGEAILQVLGGQDLPGHRQNGGQRRVRDPGEEKEK